MRSLLLVSALIVSSACGDNDCSLESDGDDSLPYYCFACDDEVGEPATCGN